MYVNITENKYVDNFLDSMRKRGFNIMGGKDNNTNIEYRQGAMLMRTRQGVVEAQFRLCYCYPDKVQAALFVRNQLSGYESLVQEVRTLQGLKDIVKIIDENKVVR